MLSDAADTAVDHSVERSFPRCCVRGDDDDDDDSNVSQAAASTCRLIDDATSSSSCTVPLNTTDTHVHTAVSAAGEPPIPGEEEGAVAACSGGDGGFSLVDVEALIAGGRELLARVQLEHDEFTHQLDLAESEIERAAERMKSAVDNRVNELLVTASELTAERCSQLERARSEAEYRLAEMSQHHRLAEQLLTHGSPDELVQYAPVLHANAQRLLSTQPAVTDVPEMTAEARDRLASLEAFAAAVNVHELRQQRMAAAADGADDNLLGRLTVTQSAPVQDGPQ